jgi:hypothetical protein
MTKKGQLTIFIILGLLLLIAVGVVLYMTREKAVAPGEAAVAEAQRVPAEMQQLNEFVKNCLYLTAKQGLEMLGQHGGYIDSPRNYNPVDPTSGKSVQFAPQSKLAIPYWWHLESRNNCKSGCVFGTERPTLTSIEEQMNNYIIDEFPKCVGTFSNFKSQDYVITTTHPPNVQTAITAGSVLITMTYPMDVTKGGSKFTLENFATELPVKFLEIYTLATNITNVEAKYNFLELGTRNLIDVFGRLDEQALPPVSDMEFGFGTSKIWTKLDVENKIMQMLTSYIPLLKVTYTKNYKYLPAPKGKDKQFYEVLYNRGFTVPVLEPHPNMDVKFSYLPWWKPYFNMNCNGQLCQAEGMSNTWGFIFGIRRYNFAYDVSYPVLVDIKQADAFGGAGYTFKFFLEANMRHNMPLASVEPNITVPLSRERMSMFCSPDQRTSGNITVNVSTSSGIPVDGANVLYRCGRESCMIGESADGKLVAQFPRCLGGILSAAHPDYNRNAVMPFDVVDASDQSVNLVFQMPYTVDFSVKKWLLKKDVTNNTWYLDTTQIFNQGRYENTIIMLEKKVNEYEEPITVLGTVCGSPSSKAKIPCGNPPGDMSKNVTMYAGDYIVKIYSFLYPQPKDLVIPAERRSYDSGPFESDGHYWMPRQVFGVGKDTETGKEKSPLMSGMAEYEWSIDEETLKNARHIEFAYVNFALDKVLPPTNRKIEDLGIIGVLQDYVDENKELVNPAVS